MKEELKIKLRNLPKAKVLAVTVFVLSIILGYSLVTWILPTLIPTGITQQTLDEELKLRKKELLARGIGIIELDMPNPVWIEVPSFERFLKGLLKYGHETVYLTYRIEGNLKFPVLWVPVGPRARVGYTCLGNLTSTVLELD